MNKAFKTISVLAAAGFVFLFVFFFAHNVFAEGKGEQQHENQNRGEIVIDNGIPVVYLTIDETAGTIDAMNQSPNRSRNPSQSPISTPPINRGDRGSLRAGNKMRRALDKSGRKEGRKEATGKRLQRQLLPAQGMRAG